ncbi:hypothetical protein F3087_43145 [Nocardia colli]|uniref:Type IV toxin-antitoxin system AbiEi family antitoxin domain-containing protein n=1 Tax=Nocardia colli TaxID=2545717 RepID=A0A5N0DV42_9NOCA|nr:hypothetical protein [Nocardia colli]KAA8879824.1 hypothetical protein F3087_43145 [Nocardia colli]
MDEIQRRRDVLTQGYTDHDIRQLYRGPGWRRLGHGCYVEQVGFDNRDSAGKHRILIESVLPTLTEDAIVSHQSAAVLYELPLWATALDLVHVTRDRPNGGRIRRASKIHCAPISDGVVEIDGWRTTSPARTVVDLARTLPFEQAVVVGDAAVRMLGITASELALELEFANRRNGISQARRTISFLDGRSESVGESRSRVMFKRHGIPVPAQQGEVRSATGEFLGRVDFYDESAGVVGEFDGQVKYGRLLKRGQAPGDAVFKEKLREDAIRDTGLRMVRWTWHDLTGDSAIHRWQHAIHEPRPTPRATITPAPLPDAPRPQIRPWPIQPHHS